MVVVTLPIRLVSEANAHEHWRTRQKRAKAQREAAYVLIRYALSHSPVAIPATVTITRIAPNMLDSDNAVGSAKHIRDGIADALRIDDRDSRVTWVVRQERGAPKEYAVKVVILSDTFTARADQLGASCDDGFNEANAAMLVALADTTRTEETTMSKQEKAVKPKATKTAKPKTPRAPKLAGDVAESKLAALVALVKERPGLASSGIATALGVTQIQVRRLAEKAIASGDVFCGGKLRFARYAATQADADSASTAARAPKAA